MKHNLNVKARTSTSTMMFHIPINMGPSCLKYETERQSIVLKINDYIHWFLIFLIS